MYYDISVSKVFNQNNASVTDRKLCKISLKTRTWKISIFILKGAFPPYPLVSIRRPQIPTWMFLAYVRDILY